MLAEVVENDEPSVLGRLHHRSMLTGRTECKAVRPAHSGLEQVLDRFGDRAGVVLEVGFRLDRVLGGGP